MLKTLRAADAPPALAARVLDGELTVAERTEVERLLGRQLVTDRGTRISIAAELARLLGIVVALTRKGDLRFRAALPHAARVAADLDRGLRQRSIDPDDARTLLRTLSAALDTLAPDRSS